VERSEFITICDRKVKLVRSEYELTQDKMAYILGISKKTLIEIEKGRKSLGWTCSVALCSIFADSEVILSIFGGKPTDIILALSFEGHELRYPQTMGGKVWWTTLEQNESYKIQQNVISQHYRLITQDGRRIISSFLFDDVLLAYKKRVTQEGKE
jgi:DNA-binding XRE family transcriptional regulator